MRKVLMIAYFFPPLGGSGVQRTLKFAKYLPELGWQPVILTVEKPPSYEADHSLAEELPDNLPVYRTRDFHLPHLLRRTARRLGLISKGGRRSAKMDSNSPNLRSPGLPPPVKSKPRTTLSKFADTWLLIPDQFIYWLPGAVWAGLKIVKQCDVIYSTSDPFTDHLVAYFLAKFSGKPWIADFRDPWTQYVVYQHSSSLRSRIDFFFEKRLLKTSDVVSVTCAATAKSFQDLYPSLSKDKFIEITNGFDAEDFAPSGCLQFDTFTITWTGRFQGKKKYSSALFQALRELRQEHPGLSSEIRVIFAGAFQEQGYGLLKEWGLEDMVEPVGYVPHHKSVELLLKSHVLLLMLNDELGTELTYPGKLFEYLAAQKTILALVPEGATAALIRDMKAGPIVPPDDVEAIKQAILDLYNQYKQGNSLSKSYNNLQRFERRSLTKRLAQCLDTVYRDRR